MLQQRPLILLCKDWLSCLSQIPLGGLGIRLMYFLLKPRAWLVQLKKMKILPQLFCLVFGLTLSEFGIKKLPKLSPKHSDSEIPVVVLFGFIVLSCLLKFCFNSWLLALLYSLIALTVLIIIAIFISKDRSLRINLIALKYDFEKELASQWY